VPSREGCLPDADLIVLAQLTFRRAVRHRFQGLVTHANRPLLFAALRGVRGHKEVRNHPLGDEREGGESRRLGRTTAPLVLRAGRVRAVGDELLPSSKNLHQLARAGALLGLPVCCAVEDQHARAVGPVTRGTTAENAMRKQLDLGGSNRVVDVDVDDA
jgi:hypothetical protein